MSWIPPNDFWLETNEKRINSNEIPSDILQQIHNKDSSDGHEKPIIFLSHCSSDQGYGHALRDLISGLGVDDEQLIYTSHELHKIPTDARIFDYLRQNLHENVYVLFLFSDEYFNSPACLNEMGAAWVLQKDYTAIYTPNFNFNNPKYNGCAIDTKKMGLILDGKPPCKAGMIDLKDKILSLFDLTVKEQKWTYLLDNFISTINSLTSNNLASSQPASTLSLPYSISKSDNDTNKKKILWVDDNPLNNRYVMDSFSPMDIDFDIARSTSEALHKYENNIKNGIYDLIITDMERDGNPTAGLVLLEQLKVLKCKTPVIVFSASASNSRYGVLAMKCGAIDCCTGWKNCIQTIKSTLNL